jgi:hypothetical protein
LEVISGVPAQDRCQTGRKRTRSVNQQLIRFNSPLLISFSKRAFNLRLDNLRAGTSYRPIMVGSLIYLCKH